MHHPSLFEVNSSIPIDFNESNIKRDESELKLGKEGLWHFANGSWSQIRTSLNFGEFKTWIQILFGRVSRPNSFMMSLISRILCIRSCD